MAKGDAKIKNLLGNVEFVLPVHATGNGPNSPALSIPALWGGGECSDWEGKNGSWEGYVRNVLLDMGVAVS